MSLFGPKRMTGLWYFLKRLWSMMWMEPLKKRWRRLVLWVRMCVVLYGVGSLEVCLFGSLGLLAICWLVLRGEVLGSVLVGGGSIDSKCIL